MNETRGFIEVLYNNIKYYIRKDKIIYVLEKLTNKDLSKENDKRLLELTDKYKLKDTIFLESVCEKTKRV